MTPPETNPEFSACTASQHELLDPQLLRRVYRTSGILLTVIGIALWEAIGAPAVLGLLIGSACSLLMLAMLEWGVRRYMSPQSGSPRALLGLTLLKMFLVTGLLVLAFLAAQRGWVGLLWVPVGFAIPHMVILLKIAGRKVNQALGGPAPRGRN